MLYFYKIWGHLTYWSQIFRIFAKIDESSMSKVVEYQVCNSVFEKIQSGCIKRFERVVNNNKTACKVFEITDEHKYRTVADEAKDKTYFGISVNDKECPFVLNQPSVIKFRSKSFGLIGAEINDICVKANNTHKYWKVIYKLGEIIKSSEFNLRRI